MIDLEPRIRTELHDAVPPLSPELRDWGGVLARAGEPSRRRRRRRRLIAFAVVGAALAMLGITPLGGAIARRVGGFSDWLAGTPGTPVSPDAQRDFEAAARFPNNPELKRLLRLDLDGRPFHLYGFETGDVVCLRVAVRAVAGAGPEAACVSRADLRRSGDLILPVKANLSVGQIAPIPRKASDPPTVARYLLTFGIAATEVDRVTVQADSGTSAATVRNGAFLHVLEPRQRGNWARTVMAVTDTGRTDVVPISVQVSGQPPLATRLPVRGPAAVDRKVHNGSIGWFERREPRGISSDEAGLGRGFPCCTGFVRVIYPDPDDFLGIALGDRTLWSAPQPPRFAMGDDVICHGLVTRGGSSAGCRPRSVLFKERPLSLSWGFSGGGQQIWIVSGLASDDVARLRVYVGSGETWDAPLRDNVTAFRVQRAKFPVRIVAYDEAGRVIDVQTIRG
jgi:hypothetical protein